MLSATTKEARIYPQFIVSTVKAFVEQQQYLFNMLWIKAIPANQRIRELEEGIIPDFIETKSDADEIRRLELALLKSAKQEILITFPTTNSFHSHKEYGVEGEDRIPFVQLLKELSDTNPQIRIKGTITLGQY